MNAPARLLVVDDDESVRALLREYLGGHGFDVVEACDGSEMRTHLREAVPDAVLLDLRLPGEDGLALARELREHHAMGVIMVTASADIVDRVVGLELGADDYIAKPFDLRELLARVRSVLRRLQSRAAAPPDVAAAPPLAPVATQAPARLRVGRCEFDLQSRRLFEIGGSELPLTAMEYDLLATFVANPNRVLTRDQLLLQTRQREWEPYDRSIDIRIGRLRRKIEPDPSGQPRCIRTVRNAGYMFVPGGS